MNVLHSLGSRDPFAPIVKGEHCRRFLSDVGIVEVPISLRVVFSWKKVLPAGVYKLYEYENETMSFDFRNLDERTRSLMLDEIRSDAIQDRLYQSPRLSEAGRQRYPNILIQAITEGSDATLATDLRVPGMMNETEIRKKPSGGVTTAVVPFTAPETLAEGEFNRFYMRAICRRAIEDGQSRVTAYRAKPVMNARSASEQLIGRQLDAQRLLEDLRTSIGVDTALGLPPGPNSGLSVHL